MAFFLTLLFFSFHPGRTVSILCRGAVWRNWGSRHQRRETSENLCSPSWGGWHCPNSSSYLPRSTWGASTRCTGTSLGSTWTSWWGRRREATTGTPCSASFPMAGLDETFAMIDEEASSPEKQEIGSQMSATSDQQHFLHFVFWPAVHPGLAYSGSNVDQPSLLTTISLCRDEDGWLWS